MSRRYGGEFSPQSGDSSDEASGNQWRGKSASRVGARVNLLFLVPLPLAFRAFFLDAGGMFWTLAGLGLLLLAAWVTREGLLAQEAYETRRVARRPAIPRKVFGSILTGAGLFTAVAANSAGWTNPAIFAVLGMILHSFSFGLDPFRDKGMEGIDQFQQDRVARVVSEAESHLKAIGDAILRLGDRQLESRVERFQDTARDMFRTVEEDPRDLSSARRYLGVYLLGAREATLKFADIYLRSKSSEDRRHYLALLDDLEKGFTAKTKALLLDNKSDMKIEIDVLRERLEREGVHLNEQ